MHYRSLIENRKSTRSFTDKIVPYALLEQIKNYYRNDVQRLIPELKTQLFFFSTSSREALEGAAGYNQFLVGAPQYILLMSEKHPLASENAGYIMEDLILKLTDLNLDSCWLTFTDSDHVKEVLGIDSELDVAAIAAFGYGVREPRRLRLNIRSMSDVDIQAKRQYFEPKKSIYDLAFLNAWGNTRNLDAAIGFYDDILWEALRAASLSPSYLNRQAYGFLLQDGLVTLVATPDAYTTRIDGKLSLGIALLHFSKVAEEWGGKLTWRFGEDAARPELPEGHSVVASCLL